MHLQLKENSNCKFWKIHRASGSDPSFIFMACSTWLRCNIFYYSYPTYDTYVFLQMLDLHFLYNYLLIKTENILFLEKRKIQDDYAIYPQEL